VTSLNNLASALRHASRYPEARRYLDEALILARQMNNEMLESVALLNLGNIEGDAGRLSEALDYHRRSLDIEWDRDEHTELTVRLNMIAEDHRKLGLYADARAYLELANDYLERSDDLKEKAINLKILGRIEMARGNYAEAQTALLEMLRLSRQIGADLDTAEANLMLASMYAEQGRFEEAITAIDSAATLVRDRAAELSIRVNLTRAEVFLHVGDGRLAAIEITNASASMEPTFRQARMLFDLLQIRSAQVNSTRLDLHRELDNLIQETNAPDLRELNLRARIELGWMHINERKYENAIRVLSRVREESSLARLRPLQAMSCFGLAKAHLAAGAFENAQRFAMELVDLASHFDGRILMSEGNVLLREAAKAEGSSRQAAEFDKRARELLGLIRAQTPSALTPSFNARYPTAN
jgi:tetratricopeptide (TPR) repeat protein